MQIQSGPQHFVLYNKVSIIENVLKEGSTVIANVVFNVASLQPTCKDLYYSVTEDTERMATKFISSCLFHVQWLQKWYKTRLVSMPLYTWKKK